MLSRWFMLAVVSIALFTYMNRADGSSTPRATVTQGCSLSVPGAVTVTLAWPAPPQDAGDVTLDLGLAKSFPPDSYQSIGPLPKTQTAHVIDGVPPSLRYHYRVSAATMGGPVAVAAGSFETKCGDD
jgi:hypothetical protein